MGTLLILLKVGEKDKEIVIFLVAKAGYTRRELEYFILRLLFRLILDQYVIMYSHCAEYASHLSSVYRLLGSIL